MPLAGKWVKDKGNWVNVGGKEIKTRTLYSNERLIIREKCERRFLNNEKVSMLNMRRL
jgi:hypothetical protein